VEGDRGTGGREPGRKRDGVREAGSGILNVAGRGRRRKNYATLRNISQSKQCKEAGADNKYRAGTGIKGYGNREV